MFYDFAITVGKKGSATETVEQVMKLTHGVIHRVEVQFPIGTQALTHCKLFHEEHQLFPTNPDGDFASDGYVIPIDDHFPLTTEPYSLKARCWNDDDTYAHTITIRVGILAEETLSPWAALGQAIKGLLPWA